MIFAFFFIYFLFYAFFGECLEVYSYSFEFLVSII